MTDHTVRFNVDLTISEGKLEVFEGILQLMIAGSQQEPGTLGYDWYLSSDKKVCRLLETYADANATVAHCTGKVVQELVPKLLEVSTLNDFEVYGDPGPKAAEMLAGLGAKIFHLWHCSSH